MSDRTEMPDWVEPYLAGEGPCPHHVLTPDEIRALRPRYFEPGTSSLAATAGPEFQSIYARVFFDPNLARFRLHAQRKTALRDLFERFPSREEIVAITHEIDERRWRQEMERLEKERGGAVDSMKPWPPSRSTLPNRIFVQPWSSCGAMCIDASDQATRDALYDLLGVAP